MENQLDILLVFDSVKELDRLIELLKERAIELSHGSSDRQADINLLFKLQAQLVFGKREHGL